LLLYREWMERLEETVLSKATHGPGPLASLRLLQRDLVGFRAAWAPRLAGLGHSGGGSTIKNKSLTRSHSQEMLVSGEREDSGTVKKLISSGLSTILGSEDFLLPHPFTSDTHLIAEGDTVNLVSESRPSSLIAHTLFSSQYKTKIALLQESTTPADPHFVLEFNTDCTKFYCCSYFPLQFLQLRQLVFPGGEDHFLHSLQDCKRWEAMGGKSGLLFYKTTDDRFVLKQMSRFEYQSFIEFAPHYFRYITQCVQKEEKTLLGKIVGVFKTGFKNTTTGLGMNMEFLIMENLFFEKEVTKSYDLKGSIRNRLMAEGEECAGQVLLDENLLRISCESPLYIGQEDKEALNDAVRRDTAFLASHQMMDYSLLAGICSKKGELVVGIIDYIRTFTWDKKLETLVKSVKSSGVFGGQAKTPTVINPDLYKMRFTDAMNRYFSMVPD